MPTTFMVRLDDLLKREIISEEEFTQANQEARKEKATLEARKTELEEMVEKERNRASLAENLPQSITGFLETFESLDIRQQKVHLQSIIKAAYIYTDKRLELELGNNVLNRNKATLLDR